MTRTGGMSGEPLQPGGPSFAYFAKDGISRESATAFFRTLLKIVVSTEVERPALRGRTIRITMRRWLFLSLLPFILTNTVIAQSATLQSWRSPLASATAPECPEHIGIRTYVSEIVSAHGVHASIAGKSIRSKTGCERHASLIITGIIARTIPLENVEKKSFEIVDFSKDGQKLLLSAFGGFENDDFHGTELAVFEIARGKPRWINSSNIFGWSNCIATVEPQGFAPDGDLLISARPSVLFGNKEPNCVSGPALYKSALLQHTLRLPDNAVVPRNGTSTTGAAAPCKSDPDILAACYTVHGRLSAWNGSPSLRIWIVGTKRILGVEEYPVASTLPAEVQDQLDWGVEAWGNFNVCPFTPDRPAAMRMVCVQSAKHVFFKDNR